jgi:sugar/nucleoside kinase (ribokinase family)
MKQLDFLVVGHVCKDLTREGYQLGGTVLYSALTAKSLGRNVAVITSAGPDLNLREILKDIEVVCLPSPGTTTFRNVYQGKERQQFIYDVARKIATEDVPPAWRKVPVVHLGPVAGEIGVDLARQFSSSLVGVTPQGWLRRRDEEGRVFPSRWVEADRLLSLVDVLIVSEDDLRGKAEALGRQLDVPRMTVVTKGASGATLHYQGRVFEYPARDTICVDPTGAGDIFAAAFLVRLAETDDPHQATRFANVAASLSVERVGIGSVPNRAQIESLTKMNDL